MRKSILQILVAMTALGAVTRAHADLMLPSTGTPYCDSFYKSLVTSPATTVDSFLAGLMQQPAFSKFAPTKVAMYHSRARHGSSLQNPRALAMFGMGDLVLAFNGAHDQANYDKLEVMCYNRTAAQFEFRAIQFPNEMSPGEAVLDEVEIQTAAGLRVTKANPTACQSCHGDTYARPVWNTYLAWDGAYGSYEESFALLRARFATEAHQTESTNLTQFIQHAQQGQERYRRFNWGPTSTPSLSAVNNALYGILVNYKMSNPALRQALAFLQRPDKAKYKFAFAGYLLSCPQNFLAHDSSDDLGSAMTTLTSERAKFELQERLNLDQDLANVGETITWKDTPALGDIFDHRVVDLSAQPSGIESMVVRTAIVTPAWRFKITRFEALYEAMGLSSDSLHLGDGKTSWDGYNEVEDYMADYLLRFYGLPAITPVQKHSAEAGANRIDLDTALTDDDYQTVVPSLVGLGLPPPTNGDRDLLCGQLAQASQQALAHERAF